MVLFVVNMEIDQIFVNLYFAYIDYNLIIGMSFWAGLNY